MEEKIRKFQNWVLQHRLYEMPYEEAKTILSQVNFYGYSIFVAAYDILMGDEPADDL